MRKIVIAIGFGMFTFVATAQEALQCANPDVLNALVFNGTPEAKLVVRRTMPDSVTGYGAPADFKLIGSSARGQNLGTVVAYKTTLESGKALDNLLGFLFDQGWKRETVQQSALAPVIVATPGTAAQLCRNGERRNMQVQEIDGVRYATISGGQANPPRACDVPLPQPAGFGNPMAATTAAQAMMPQFSFPATARLNTAAGPRGNFGGGSGGSGSSFTSTRIDSPDSAVSLARSLAQQLTQQGWRRDAEWNGALSTGSTWTRSAADGKPYWGILEILSVGGGPYDVGFTVAGRPQ